MQASIDFKHGVIEMIHGSGGRASANLIQTLFIHYFDNALLRQGNDQAVFPVSSARMVMATDSHVVTPLFFAGGNIGSLAVHGSINDVAMAGAVPHYLSAAFILEEGFPLAQLKNIVIAMANASKEAGVPIITGDTKVVERGKCDGVFITTTGVGTLADGIHISGDLAVAGDVIIVSGAIGDHGIAILSSREGLTFETTIASDSAALHQLVAAMLAVTPEIHCLRDPTRGGLATTLNELAGQSGVSMLIEEAAIPIKPAVKGACELLGLDPLYIANEGKLVCIVPAQHAEQLLTMMHQHPLGYDAAMIGHVTDGSSGMVIMKTAFGGKRVVDWLVGEQLPRIC